MCGTQALVLARPSVCVWWWIFAYAFLCPSRLGSLLWPLKAHGQLKLHAGSVVTCLRLSPRPCAHSASQALTLRFALDPVHLVSSPATCMVWTPGTQGCLHKARYSSYKGSRSGKLLLAITCIMYTIQRHLRWEGMYLLPPVYLGAPVDSAFPCRFSMWLMAV